MRKKLSYVLIFVLCILMLSSCGEKTVEYGYGLLVETDEKYVSYRFGYKIRESIEYSDREERLFKIKLSHGASGPWYDGGFAYPEIERIEIVFDDEVLCKDEYFDYLDSYIFVSRDVVSAPSELGATLNNRELHFYTSEKYDGNPNSFVRFNNEEEYLLRLSEDKEEYTFQIREIYFDGSVEVVCEAKLYARFEGDTVHFSAEPFDEAE